MDKTVSQLDEALNARKAALLKCPIRRDHTFSPGKCPVCKATSRMPCGINTEQDAIIVDVVKEIVAAHQPKEPSRG